MIVKETNQINNLRGTILIVDEDVTICNMVKAHFGPEGFAVDYCTGYDDLYSVEPSNYSLIIMSLDLEPDSALGIVE